MARFSINPTTWTAIGTGPLRVQPDANIGVLVAFSPTSPAVGDPAFSVPSDGRDLNISGNAWAMSASGYFTTVEASALVSAGGGSGGGAATIADGADVAQGTTTDAAGTPTVIGQLKAILAKLIAGIPVTGTFWQTTQPVSGSAAAGAAPTSPPLSVSGVDGSGNKQHVKVATDGTVVVSDAQSQAFQGVVAMVVGTAQTAQRSVGVLATVAGNVALTLADASTITLPVYVGWQTLPFAATTINSSGTTATATYFNLK